MKLTIRQLLKKKGIKLLAIEPMDYNCFEYCVSFKHKEYTFINAKLEVKPEMVVLRDCDGNYLDTHVIPWNANLILMEQPSNL